MDAASTPPRHSRSFGLRQIADAKTDRRHGTVRRATIMVGGRELADLDPASRSIAEFPMCRRITACSRISQSTSNYGFHAARSETGASIGSTVLAYGSAAAPGRALARPAATGRAGARAHPAGADLLLLDEPFSALDVPLRLHLRRQLLALQGDLSATTILVPTIRRKRRCSPMKSWCWTAAGCCNPVRPSRFSGGRQTKPWPACSVPKCRFWRCRQ